MSHESSVTGQGSGCGSDGRSDVMRRCFGFTVVELMVAAVVMSVALVGIYAVFRQALDAERAAGKRWRGRAAAAAVCEHLADAIEHSVNLPGRPALEIAAGDDGGASSLVCMVDEYASNETGGGSPQWRRYRWGFDSHDARAGTVELQRRPLAGQTDIGTVPRSGSSNESIWAPVAPTVIGHQVATLSVMSRVFDGPWEANWSGAVGERQFRVRVTVGEHTAERIVTPRVDGLLMVATEG